MEKTEFLKIRNGQMVKLKPEYTVKELAESKLLGSLSSVWQALSDKYRNGNKKLPKQILGSEDRSFIGSINEKKVILAKHIKEYLKNNG